MSDSRIKAVERQIGARIRSTGRLSQQVDYLDDDGKVVATRPASALEVRMWNALVGSVYAASISVPSAAERANAVLPDTAVGA